MPGSRSTLDRQREVEAIAAAAREQASQETLRGGDVSLVGNRARRSITKSRRAVEAEEASTSASPQRQSQSQSNLQQQQRLEDDAKASKGKVQRAGSESDSLTSVSELGTPPRGDLDSAVSVSSLGTPPREEEEGEAAQQPQVAQAQAQPAESSTGAAAAPAGDDDDDDEAPDSRPRGTTRKSQTAQQSEEQQQQDTNNNDVANHASNSNNIDSNSNSQVADAPPRRKPGRPRKHPLPDAAPAVPALAPPEPEAAPAPIAEPSPERERIPLPARRGRPRPSTFSVEKKATEKEPVPAIEDEEEEDDDDEVEEVPAPLRAHNLGAYWDLPASTTVSGSGPRKSARAMRRVSSERFMSDLSSAEDDADEVASQLAQVKQKKARRATEPAKGGSHSAAAAPSASASAAAGPSAANATPVKRGPGRPRKIVPEVVIGTSEAAAPGEAAPNTPSGTSKAAARPAWQRKVFLTAGLYSATFKADKPGVRRSRASMPTKLNGTMAVTSRKEQAAALVQGTARQRGKAGQTIFPPPVHFGETLLVQQRDFRLPFPLLEQEGGIRDKMNSRRKPPPYGQISTNRFVSRKKIKAEEPICQCDPSSDCGEDCMNRILQYVCDPKSCPCGERCTNGTLGKRKGHKTDVSYYGERGFGLRAAESIPKNAFIDEYRGEVINMAECARRVTSHYMAWGNYYFLDYDTTAGEVLDAGLRGNALRFANHSCNPNCYIEKWLISGSDENRDAEFQIGLFALRDIQAGEELTYDYGWSSFARKAVAGGIAASGMTGGLTGGLAGGLMGGLGGPRPPMPSAAPPPSTDITMSERCLCGAANCAGILGGKKAPPGAAGKQLIAAATAAAAGALSATSKGKGRRRDTETPQAGSPQKSRGGIASASASAAASPATGSRKVKPLVKRPPRPLSDQQSHDPVAERAARAAREARQEEAAAKAAAVRAKRLAERRARTGAEASSDEDEQEAERERYEGETQDEDEADEALQMQLRANVEHVLANGMDEDEHLSSESAIFSDSDDDDELPAPLGLFERPALASSRSRGAARNGDAGPSGSRPFARRAPGRPAPRASAIASRERMFSPTPSVSRSPSPAPVPRVRKFERRRTEHEMLQDLADEAAKKAAERAVSEESAGGTKQTTRSGRAVAPPSRWEPTGRKHARVASPTPEPAEKPKTLRGARPTPWVYRPVESKRKSKEADGSVSATVLGKRKAGEQGAPGNDSLDADTSRDADQPPVKRKPGRPRKHPLPEPDNGEGGAEASGSAFAPPAAGPSTAGEESPAKQKRAPRRKKKRGPGRPRIHPLPFFDFSKYPPGTEFVTGDGQPWDLQSKPPATGRRPKIFTKEQYKKKLALRRERNAYLARIRRVSQKSGATAKGTSEQRDADDSSESEDSGGSSESGSSDEEDEDDSRQRPRSRSTSSRAATTSPNKSSRKRKERFVTPGEGDEEEESGGSDLPGTLASVPPGEVMLLNIVPELLRQNGMSLDDIRRARNAFGSRVRRYTERGYDRTAAMKLASKINPKDNPELALTRAQVILQRLRDADKKVRGRELARIRREKIRKEKEALPVPAPVPRRAYPTPSAAAAAAAAVGGMPGPSSFPGAFSGGSGSNANGASGSGLSMSNFLPSHLPPGSSVPYSPHVRALGAGASPGVPMNQFTPRAPPVVARASPMTASPAAARASPIASAIAGPSSRPGSSRREAPEEGMAAWRPDVHMYHMAPPPTPALPPPLPRASAPVPLPWEGTEWNASLPPRARASPASPALGGPSAPRSPAFPLGPPASAASASGSIYRPHASPFGESTSAAAEKSASPEPSNYRTSGRLLPTGSSRSSQFGRFSSSSQPRPVDNGAPATTSDTAGAPWYS